MDTKNLTDKELLPDAIHVAGTLLLRFERDFLALTDYLTREEQDKWLGHIVEGVRNHLLIERRWTHEAANLMAKRYRQILVVRLTKPQAFSVPSGFKARTTYPFF